MYLWRFALLAQRDYSSPTTWKESYPQHILRRHRHGMEDDRKVYAHRGRPADHDESFGKWLGCGRTVVSPRRLSVKWGPVFGVGVPWQFSSSRVYGWFFFALVVAEASGRGREGLGVPALCLGMREELF